MPKRTSLRLTKRVIDDAKPNSQTWDSEVPGFGVRRTAAGTRSFIYAYRTRSGQQRKMALGGYPALTVEAARSIAREHAVKIARGEDPAAERRAQRQAETLAEMVDHYCDAYGPHAGLKARTIRDARQVLVVHALPKFGKTRILDFRPDDIRRIHGDARDRVGPYQANRLLAALSKIFSLAIEQQVRVTNPCKGVRKFPEDERWRNLSTEEVRRLLEACDRCPYEDGANATSGHLANPSKIRRRRPSQSLRDRPVSGGALTAAMRDPAFCRQSLTSADHRTVPPDAPALKLARASASKRLSRAIDEGQARRSSSPAPAKLRRCSLAGVGPARTGQE